MCQCFTFISTEKCGNRLTHYAVRRRRSACPLPTSVPTENDDPKSLALLHSAAPSHPRGNSHVLLAPRRLRTSVEGCPLRQSIHARDAKILFAEFRGFQLFRDVPIETQPFSLENGSNRRSSPKQVWTHLTNGHTQKYLFPTRPSVS